MVCNGGDLGMVFSERNGRYPRDWMQHKQSEVCDENLGFEFDVVGDGGIGGSGCGTR